MRTLSCLRGMVVSLIDGVTENTSMQGRCHRGWGNIDVLSTVGVHHIVTNVLLDPDEDMSSLFGRRNCSTQLHEGDRNRQAAGEGKHPYSFPLSGCPKPEVARGSRLRQSCGSESSRAPHICQAQPRPVISLDAFRPHRDPTNLVA